MEHDRGRIVLLDHAVDDGGALLPAQSGTLPEELVTHRIAAHVRMDAHVLDPDYVVLVEDVVEHLGEDKSDYLTVLLGDQREAAVQVGLEMVPAAGTEIGLPILGEILPLVLEGGREVLLDAGYLQFADGLHILEADGAYLHAHISSGCPMPRQSNVSARTALVQSTRVRRAATVSGGRGFLSLPRTDTSA